jgi:KUP system potassium uptake protein
LESFLQNVQVQTQAFHILWMKLPKGEVSSEFFFESSIVARRVLLFVAILGMCMLIGDGILMPAISGWAPHFSPSLV